MQTSWLDYIYILAWQIAVGLPGCFGLPVYPSARVISVIIRWRLMRRLCWNLQPNLLLHYSRGRLVSVVVVVIPIEAHLTVIATDLHLMPCAHKFACLTFCNLLATCTVSLAALLRQMVRLPEDDDDDD